MKKIYLFIICLLACTSSNGGKFGAGIIPSTFTAGAITASTSMTVTPLGGSATQSVSVSTTGALTSTTFSAASRGYYGIGNFGAAVFDGSATPSGATKNSPTSYTLNQDVNYTSITVSASAGGTGTVNTFAG